MSLKGIERAAEELLGSLPKGVDHGFVTVPVSGELVKRAGDALEDARHRLGELEEILEFYTSGHEDREWLEHEYQKYTTKVLEAHPENCPVCAVLGDGCLIHNEERGSK